MPEAVWKPATKPSAMYSGQFEIRRVPLAGPPASVVVLDVSLSEPHAASSDEPNVSPAAAAALPPRNRRRVVRPAVKRASRRGSISRDMRRVPFVGSGKGWGGLMTGSGVVEHVLEILRGRDVGAGQHQRGAGSPRDVDFVAGA